MVAFPFSILYKALFMPFMELMTESTERNVLRFDEDAPFDFAKIYANLVVAIVDSASMEIADRYDDETHRSAAESLVRRAGLQGATRLNLAKSLLLEDNAKFLRDVARRYKLRLYFLSDAARSEPGDVAEMIGWVKQLQPTGSSTPWWWRDWTTSARAPAVRQCRT